MKKILFITLFLCTLLSAQVTVKFEIKDNGNAYKVLWTFTQITDSTTVFYSPKFSSLLITPNGSTVPTPYSELMGNYNYTALSSACTQFSMRQTGSTAVPKTAITLQALYNAGSDTANAAFIRVVKGGAETAADTNGTFRLRAVGNDYRIKLVNTGGRITSGFISLIFLKPTAKGAL